MKILRASEDYLEAMLMMERKHGFIRSVDVAEYLSVSKPSVTYATKRLRESGHITMEKGGRIALTAAGMEIAETMLRRHQALTDILISLGVRPEIAERDACRMEHDLSRESFDAICAVMRKR